MVEWVSKRQKRYVGNKGSKASLLFDGRLMIGKKTSIPHFSEMQFSTYLSLAGLVLATNQDSILSTFRSLAR
jgi:hypothetical protein